MKNGHTYVMRLGDSPDREDEGPNTLFIEEHPISTFAGGLVDLPRKL
jgi:hypothetical protein